MILGVDPKVDYAFKKVFATESNKMILVDLLNAVLVSTLEEPIEDVEILNPFNEKEGLDDKLSIVDVKARDRRQRWFNVEMQMLATGSYPKRVLYYWSRIYFQQLTEGVEYVNLQPVYSINFVNGSLFPGTAYHQEFSLRSDVDPSQVFCRDMSIHLIELPKFRNRLDNLPDALSRWCWYFRHAENLETTAIPTTLRTPQIERAVEVLRVMTQTEIERERYESREKARRDAIWIEGIRRREQEEIEKGKEEIEKGKVEIEKGKEEIEKIRAEVEKTRAEAEKTRAEVEKTRAEAEKTRAEAEKTRAEAEKTRAEAEEITKDPLRLGEQRGEMVAMRASIAMGLEARFGPDGKAVSETVNTIADLEKLRAIQRLLYTASTIDEIRALIQQS